MFSKEGISFYLKSVISIYSILKAYYSQLSFHTMYKFIKNFASIFRKDILNTYNLICELKFLEILGNILNQMHLFMSMKQLLKQEKTKKLT